MIFLKWFVILSCVSVGALMWVIALGSFLLWAEDRSSIKHTLGFILAGAAVLAGAAYVAVS